MNVKEIDAVWRYLESGHIEHLEKYLDAGGTLSKRSQRILIEALRSPPRRRQNWERDRRIIAAMAYVKLIRAAGGDAPSIEEARNEVATRFNVSDATVKRIWEERQAG